MRVSSKDQRAFALDVALLILFINRSGYGCTGGEWWRTPEMVKIYASRGTGSLKSLHPHKLAIDLNLFKDGDYLESTEDHRLFGTFWESLDPLNRWGGRFEDGNYYERCPEPWR